MANKILRVETVERRLADGQWETISFAPGVNLLVGAPGTGKTKWLQTLDYLLGDSGEMPLESTEDEGLSSKYDAAAAQVFVDGKEMRIERRWREPGAKTKIFVDDEAKSSKEFQQLLLDQLDIPQVNFPKGNPMSGQTWPELSFRMLLRHIYRQQRFWGGLVDQQPEAEQLACVLQFLGLAEHVFTEEYGELVQKILQVERLKARREQYSQTLDELSREILGGDDLTVSVSTASVASALRRLEQEAEDIRSRRSVLISQTADSVLPADERQNVEKLGEERARLVAELEQSSTRLLTVVERLREVKRYRADLADELSRIDRAETAGTILGDLRVTHCPACDRPIREVAAPGNGCFLCHHADTDDVVSKELGVTRIRFERERLAAELKEADDLVSVLSQEAERGESDAIALKEQLGMLERAIAPSREIVAPLVQEGVSALDMALGQLSERQRQLNRIASAVELAAHLGDQVVALEREIEPLQAAVDEAKRSADFGAAASLLEDGMNDYLNAINVHRPNVWRHSPVRFDLSANAMTVRVGSRRWQAALGGTDQLYFLMAYQYGLMTLTNKIGCHYPGLSIIDVPGDFAGEKIGDRENFIVQPFMDLLGTPEYEGAQCIVSGAKFSGLNDVHRISLKHVYVAS